MGIGSSKSPQAPPLPLVPPPPDLSAEAVEEMCKEAYAAGVGDADVYHTAQREAMQRQEAVFGAGGCLLSAWLAFVYGRARGTRFAEEAAATRFDAQQAMLEQVNRELVATTEENKSLTSIRQEQQTVIAQQREELQRAARERKVLQQSVQSLRRRNASVQRQLRGLSLSLSAIQRQVYAGLIGAGVLLLAVVWSTRPLRQSYGHASAPPVGAPAPAAAATEIAAEDGEMQRTEKETEEGR
ncbi:hypothetical protein N2W54_006866 [Lotmaria passim]